MDRERPQILVIEHDPWRRTDLVAQLAAAGYHVRDASNGFSGLRLATSAPPDAIVLGIQLSEVPAHEVQEQLGGQAHTRGIPVMRVPRDTRTSHVAADVDRLLAGHLSATRA